MKKMKRNKQIDLSFYPAGYNVLDIFVDDFWTVKINIRDGLHSASMFIRLGADQKDEVVRRAKSVLASMKEATK